MEILYGVRSIAGGDATTQASIIFRITSVFALGNAHLTGTPTELLEAHTILHPHDLCQVCAIKAIPDADVAALTHEV